MIHFPRATAQRNFRVRGQQPRLSQTVITCDTINRRGWMQSYVVCRPVMKGVACPSLIPRLFPLPVYAVCKYGRGDLVQRRLLSPSLNICPRAGGQTFSHWLQIQWWKAWEIWSRVMTPGRQRVDTQGMVSKHEDSSFASTHSQRPEQWAELKSCKDWEQPGNEAM